MLAVSACGILWALRIQIFFYWGVLMPILVSMILRLGRKDGPCSMAGSASLFAEFKEGRCWWAQIYPGSYQDCLLTIECLI